MTSLNDRMTNQPTSLISDVTRRHRADWGSTTSFWRRWDLRVAFDIDDVTHRASTHEGCPAGRDVGTHARASKANETMMASSTMRASAFTPKARAMMNTTYVV